MGFVGLGVGFFEVGFGRGVVGFGFKGFGEVRMFRGVWRSFVVELVFLRIIVFFFGCVLKFLW